MDKRNFLLIHTMLLCYNQYKVKPTTESGDNIEGTSV